MTTSPIRPLDDPATCCSLGSGVLNAEEAARYTSLFKVLADPARLRILSHITDDGCNPVTASELTVILGLGQSTISHHLKKLTEAGMLERRRVGRTVQYHVLPELFAELRTVLQTD
ncbi:ArsR/SmtB family transcription factor [Corynebacterium alimapuense]|uniref:Transcriptional regulator n=1 Tax=Corynebacterium alimapuense TaxID=1576874 RepID=A0A3M8K582_9CORY|nr:metalloregulator ArsR/SmtB family transcription factor [Corynebacterium alimapuense]RNE48387.1 transcriptional regulator [Corynebacterium alimapuense]